MSACLVISSTVSPSSEVATPTVAVMVTGPAERTNGSLNAAVTRSANASASAESRRFSKSTANSSPLMRAATSDSLAVAARRRAKAVSRSSPSACPSVSLTSLKSSRSMNKTAVTVPVRRASASACSARSANRVRFGSSVSASWKARCRSSSCRRRSSEDGAGRRGSVADGVVIADDQDSVGRVLYEFLEQLLALAPDPLLRQQYPFHGQTDLADHDPRRRPAGFEVPLTPNQGEYASWRAASRIRAQEDRAEHDPVTGRPNVAGP